MSAIAKTASITLITAVPGSGKTLRAVWYAREAVKLDETVFWSNINGMAVVGTFEFADPTRWEELPAGSVLIVDEAQKFFRAGVGSGANLPSYIAAMEEIRHRGIRLILLTQHPALIHANIRALVGFHEHLVRENGKESAIVYTRSKVIDNVRSDKALAAEDHHSWAFPKDCYELYKSAEVHTFKRTIPRKYIRAAIMALAAAAIFGLCVWKVQSNIAGPDGGQGAAPAAQAASPPPSGWGGPQSLNNGPRWASATDYAQDHLPRFGTMPWTAPIYDDRPRTTDPQVYCMSSSGGIDANGKRKGPSCGCLTEQGTRYELGPAECRTVARDGMPYNPYRASMPQQPVQVAAAPAPGIDLGGAPRAAHGSGGPYGSTASYGDYGIHTVRYPGRSVRDR
ncbi:zonular occludens toxin domain-containing protein [Luteimonas sp. TWI406]|uniref:zonular occludens toxin domain-containing protein n=1 Tax=Luteimonas sp. TWI406 TaxID=3136777 RepID=UPI00320971E1